MSNDGYVAPVNHGVLSATGSVAVGAAGGALKSFGKTMLWVAGGIAAVTFLAAGGFFAAGTALVSGAGLAAAAGNISVGSGLVAGLLTGGLIGVPVAAFTGAFTGIFGAGKGAIEAKNRVSMEKGTARAMEMQLAAYQSMAAANEKTYNLPAQGTRFNAAPSKIDASTADHNGTMVSQQLARA
jgi:hypothetical protein